MSKLHIHKLFYRINIFGSAIFIFIISISFINIFSVNSQTLPARPIVDIMVLYTPAARLAAGGKETIESMIGLAVEETNQIYRDSQVTGRLRLVHSEEVDYVETNDVGIDLNQFFTNNSHVVELQERYGADLVSLFVKGRGGVADLLNSEKPGNLHSVMGYFDAVVYYVFEHEIGHNMGLCHDSINNNSCKKYDPTFYPYANGYNDPQGAFSDVMSSASVNNNCPGLGGCPLAPLYSNPNINFDGRSAGIANQADNARALNETMSIVAQSQVTKINNSIYLPAIYSSAGSSQGVSLTQLDVTTVSSISNFKIASLSDSSFITIDQDANNILNLRSWVIESNGLIRSNDSISEENVVKARITSLTKNRFVTISLDKLGVVQISAWNVSLDGKITLFNKTYIVGRTSNDIGVVALDEDHFAIVERIISGDYVGDTNLSLWSISPDGSFSSKGGIIISTNTDGVDVTTASGNKVFIISKRSDTSGLQIAMSTAIDNQNITFSGTRLSNIASEIAITSLTSDRVVTATSNDKGNLELTTWDVVAQVFGRTTDIVSTNLSATKIAVSSLPDNRIATVLRDSGNNARIIVWGGIQNGTFTNVGSNDIDMSGNVSDVSITTLGRNRLIVAVQRNDGRTQLSTWNVEN